jgi:hypothetical protein
MGEVPERHRFDNMICPDGTPGFSLPVGYGVRRKSGPPHLNLGRPVRASTVIYGVAAPVKPPRMGKVLKY